MNDLTTRLPSQSSASQLTLELAKMLGLVAPITMTADQHTIWLASAVDALAGIRAAEVEAVSVDVRRIVTRPSQIVPEIARLVFERRAEQLRIDRQKRENEEAMKAPPKRRHIADRDRRNFTAEDWAELNQWLEQQGSPVRYLSDGRRQAT